MPIISQEEIEQIINYLETGVVPAKNFRSEKKRFIKKCESFKFSRRLFYTDESGLVKFVIATDDIEAVKNAILTEHSINHFGIII